MTRNKKAGAPASSLRTTSAAAGSQQASGSKRPRKDDVDPGSSDHNARLLASNSFATLPVQTVTEQPVPKKVKIPPLFTTTKEIAALRNDLAAAQIHPLFKLCSMGSKIVCSTEADFKATRRFLDSKQLEYYTHDTPGSKPLKVVIRGLPDYPPEVIVEELMRNKLKPIKVFPMKRAEAGNHRDLLYLAHLEKGSVNMSDLRKVRALFNIIVDWDPYRPKKRDVTQCNNCLSFGHGTRNCHMKPRCGKCAGDHETSECVQMEESAEPKCANCGANHEGRNRACPKRAEFMEIRKKASTRNQNGRNRRQPPPNTVENFPPLRSRVPNLPPLQLNQRQEIHQPAFSVQQRLAAAAAAPSVQDAPPPTWGIPGSSSTSAHPSNDDSLFSPDQMMEFVQAMYRGLSRCRSKEQQIEAATRVLLNFMNQHGP